MRSSTACLYEGSTSRSARAKSASKDSHLHGEVSEYASPPSGVNWALGEVWGSSFFSMLDDDTKCEENVCESAGDRLADGVSGVGAVLQTVLRGPRTGWGVGVSELVRTSKLTRTSFSGRSSTSMLRCER